MDFTNAFKSEIFRPLVTLFVPGCIAVAPHIVVANYYAKQVGEFWDKYPSAFTFLAVIFALAAGLTLEDIGMAIERQWDKLIYKGEPEHIERWHEYLQLDVDDEIIAQRYLRLTLTWMKFELAMVPALLSFGVGLVWVNNLYDVWKTRGVVIACLIIAALLAFLIHESYVSAQTLSLTRADVIEGARRRATREASKKKKE
ncbi:MAG TPA: hypothetical protein VM914_12475 [Pyrinomonadaceae bacterium]|jgi:hypothetical protein|nr:hypothetical protein [Pyrinomonadaceae bacterium]